MRAGLKTAWPCAYQRHWCGPDRRVRQHRHLRRCDESRSLSGGTDGSTPLVITLNGNAQPTAAVQALARQRSGLPRLRLHLESNASALGGRSRAASFVEDGDRRPYLSINHTPPQARVVTPSGVAASYTDERGRTLVDGTLALGAQRHRRGHALVPRAGEHAPVRISANYADADNTVLQGLALTRACTGRGTWQYSSPARQHAGPARRHRLGAVPGPAVGRGKFPAATCSDDPSTLASTVELQRFRWPGTSTLAARSLQLWRPSATADPCCASSAAPRPTPAESASASRVVISASVNDAPITTRATLPAAASSFNENDAANGQVEHRPEPGRHRQAPALVGADRAHQS